MKLPFPDSGVISLCDLISNNNTTRPNTVQIDVQSGIIHSPNKNDKNDKPIKHTQIAL